MPASHKWIGKLLLKSPASLRSLRDVPILGHLIHRLSHRILPTDETVWARIESGPATGLRLELNPRTGQSYLRGEAEPRIQKVLAERLHPGMVFYDLGANIGLFTLLAARLVGATGRVVSFEPDGDAAARLRRNVQRNQFTNVTVIEAGVWSKSGYVNFVPADSSSPDHGLGRFVDGANQATGIAKQCLAMDDLVGNAPPPHAIKCDVEGAEVEALRGAEKLLRTHHPWMICEMHSESNKLASSALLARFGYTVEMLDDDHALAVPKAEF
ncbi:MAG: FkbM family methyltransferase [Candidatus Acidiferrum sp.]